MFKKIFLATAMFVPLVSHAIPVRWTLQDVSVGVSLNAPPTNPLAAKPLTGSFVYDADLNLYSSIDINSSLGNGILCDPTRLDVCIIQSTPVFAAKHYDTAITTSPTTSATGLVGANASLLNGVLDGDTILVMLFSQALTNAGGTIALAVGGTEYFCANLTCATARDGLFRLVLGPSASAPAYNPRIVGVAVVPEPAMGVLFATGLILLVGVRRKLFV